MSTIEPVPLIDVIVESPQWTADAEDAVRRALTQAAIATGTNFTDRTLAVLLTDDAAVRSTRSGAASTSRPTCCRFRRRRMPVSS
jgi:hypothetical protein